MTGRPARPSRSEQPDHAARRAAERRRRLADALSDVLPEGTRDERGDAWGERGSSRGGAGDDEWLRRQVPPHHG